VSCVWFVFEAEGNSGDDESELGEGGVRSVETAPAPKQIVDIN